MENQTQPNTLPVQPPMQPQSFDKTPPPPSITEVPKRKAPIFTIIICILLLLIIGVTGYFGYKNYLLKNQKTVTPPPPQLPIKPSVIPTTILPTETSSNANLTTDWKEYRNDKYGFFFKYDPTITFQSEDINNLNKIHAGGLNRTQYFIEQNKSQPPITLFGLNPQYEMSTAGVGQGRDYVLANYFSIWVMENNQGFNPDVWYEKFVYFPINSNKKFLNQYTSSISTITVDGVEGKYIVYKDVIEQKLILIPKNNFMYLIHINNSSEIDNQILSSFKFTD